MNPAFLRLAAALMGVSLLTFAYNQVHSPSVMARAAGAFLDSLTPEQRAKATFRFDDDERLNWHFVPRPRKGLPLREMTPSQKLLAHALLSAGLSQSGYIKAATIMSLEEVLRILENDSGERRNPEGYYFSIFGRPSDKDAWGFRVEGHHISQNFTILGGRAHDAPSFFGANPAEVRQGPRKGLRALAAEEDLARALLDSLDAEQKKIAIVDSSAYPDILTSASRKASLQGQPSGLPASRLTPRQFELLAALLGEYARNVPDDMARARLEQIEKAGRNLHFAWAGVEKRGGPHYYRVQAPAFLVEYDNTQNQANHIHSVWRDFDGDFGLDLLKAHYQASHR
ncbi:MAG: DUF3500 domain-containing protein [Bryobacterales bacterium]|nr:DUF3500 domain-containing protein [Bryobacterales bacterium]